MKQIVDKSWQDSQQNVAGEIAQEKLDNIGNYQYFCGEPEWQEGDYEYGKILVYIEGENGQNSGYLIDKDGTKYPYKFNEDILSKSWKKLSEEEFIKNFPEIYDQINKTPEEIIEIIGVEIKNTLEK